MLQDPERAKRLRPARGGFAQPSLLNARIRLQHEILAGVCESRQEAVEGSHTDFAF
jgi:hypothetical protein